MLIFIKHLRVPIPYGQIRFTPLRAEIEKSSTELATKEGPADLGEAPAEGKFDGTRARANLAV